MDIQNYYPQTGFQLSSTNSRENKDHLYILVYISTTIIFLTKFYTLFAELAVDFTHIHFDSQLVPKEALTGTQTGPFRNFCCAATRWIES